MCGSKKFYKQDSWCPYSAIDLMMQAEMILYQKNWTSNIVKKLMVSAGGRQSPEVLCKYRRLSLALSLYHVICHRQVEHASEQAHNQQERIFVDLVPPRS